MRWVVLAALFCGTGVLASPARAGQARTPALQAQEQEDLEKALSEAGASPVEYLRALEKHLRKYPQSPRRAELERAAVRTAIEAGDDARIIEYGEHVLARQPDDLQILDRVTRALLVSDSKQNAERALKYATRYGEIAAEMRREHARSGMSPAQWQIETDRAAGRALRYQARASGNLGRLDESLALARRAWDTDPNADAAREIARACGQLGRPEDAARALADAFTIPDPQSTDATRSRDRVRMGELYRQAKGSDAGLGDLLLAAYDRNLALIRTRELRLRENDPNAKLTDPMEFTLSGPDGQKLSMAGLKGKVVVFDFWATWCVPCRTQHPLYEQVKQRFGERSDVVFLSVDTDEDRDLVKPFLEEVKWRDPIYFEDGLSRALAIMSIPTTIVIDKEGRVFSRMNGYVPERFVEMLGERIVDALVARR